MASPFDGPRCLVPECDGSQIASPGLRQDAFRQARHESTALSPLFEGPSNGRET